MLLSEYLAGLSKIIEKYSKTGLISASSLHADFRTEKLGLVHGSVAFIDDSRLFFTEYIDARYKIEKLSYSYHYQRHNGSLVFRYDNANHKPRLRFTHHKHTAEGGVIATDVPELRDVLDEIMQYLV